MTQYDRSHWSPKKVLAHTVPGFLTLLIGAPLCIVLGANAEQSGHEKANRAYIACVEHARDVRDCGKRP